MFDDRIDVGAVLDEFVVKMRAGHGAAVADPANGAALIDSRAWLHAGRDREQVEVVAHVSAVVPDGHAASGAARPASVSHGSCRDRHHRRAVAGGVVHRDAHDRC